MKIKYKLLLGLLLWIPLLSAAQPLQDSLQKVDEIFAAVSSKMPGVSVLISRGGEVIYHKHKGLANMELGVPITDSTRFEAGSVSKQFTATAVLLLVEEGKVGLDDDVRKYIPELPQYEKTITVRHLLNHTSGLKDWGVVAGLGGWPRGTREYTNELALEYITKQTTLNYTPGAEYLYSNSNYTLLTFIAERVSGQTLPDFTEERIFKPLGMKATSWRTDFRKIVPYRATAYNKKGDRYVTIMPFENTYGHAALLTTTADLDKWNTSWKNSPLGGASLLDLRTERGVLNSGDTIDYAGGVFVNEYNGHPSVNHSGATAGYRAWLGYYPEEDLSVVYLSNNGSLSTTGTGKKISAVFLGTPPKTNKNKKQEKPAAYHMSKDELSEYTGRYVSAECGGEWIATLEGDGALMMTSQSHQKRKFKPSAKDTFLRIKTQEVKFKRDQSGKLTGFYISVPRARNVWFERVEN
ncbi:serine hydrolase domain-containing protein [Sinomicrobium sp.]